MASADLVWELIRHNNKYVQKRGGVRLSNDPFNNSGKYTKRQSGFLGQKGAVVRVKGQKELYVAVNDGTNANKPRKQWVKKATGAKASDASKAAAAVRPDLADVTFRRAAKLNSCVRRLAKVKTARKEVSKARTYKRTNVRAKKAGKKN